MAYAYYRTITIDHTQIGENLVDFPLAITLSDPSFKLVAGGGKINNTVVSNSQTVPADLAFYLDIDHLLILDFEVKSYDSTNGIITAYVKTDISTTVDTVIYVFYDDVSVITFQGNVNATWDADYVAVIHLGNGVTLSAKDSTVNAHNGAITAATAAAGNIDGAASFNGSTSGISLPGSHSYSPDLLTVSIWVKTSTAAVSFLFGIYDETTPGSSWALFQLNPGVEWFTTVTVTLDSAHSIADGIAHLITATVNNDGQRTIELFIDGVSQGVGTTAGAPPLSQVLTNLTLGLSAANHQPYTGLISEARVSDVRRSVNYILAEYAAEKASSTLLTIGAQTSVGPIVTIMANIEQLQIGRVTSLVQNTVYALPMRRCILYTAASSPTIKQSNLVGISPSTTLTLGTNGDAEVNAAFIELTSTGPIDIVLKAY